MRVRAGMVALVGLAACGVFDPDPLPPHGETLVVVDTDLPVPSVVSRLRIDVFGADGTWIAHRDDVRPDPRDWPASFSVFNDDPTKDKMLRIRLRAYLDARTVPYRGGDKLESGVTPDVEPNPAISVDRTIEVRLVHGTRARARVLLSGECIGRRECAAEKPLEIDSSFDRAVPSAVGTYGAQPCSGAPLEERVCVPGGAFVLGDAFDRVPTGGDLTSSTFPERVVVISRFEIDRDEVTVARFRAALAAGFSPKLVQPGVEDDVFPPKDIQNACTWSETPRGREEYPLTCVPWDTADAFCRFSGGELPTEAQFEYVALAAGRPRKTLHPWGDEAPSCDRGIFGRVAFNDECIDRGEGPAPLASDGDTNVLGVRHLATSVEELARDRHAAYSDPCWTNAPVVDPFCGPSDKPEEDPMVTRGGSWTSDAGDLRVVRRINSGSRVSQNSFVGFRCVYASP
jgi:formylglycine-generating enzyme required for sulfatase activity